MLKLKATLHKTELGLAALKDRERCPGLNPRLRTLLLQVDGKKTVEEMIGLATSIGGSDESVIKMLALGVVEAVDPPPEPVPEPTPAPAAPVVSEPSKAAAPVAESEPVEPKKPAEPPVSSKLPDALKPTAATMRKLADDHLGLSAILLKRRISGADTEQELRLALRELREALVKAVGVERAGQLLTEVDAALPMIGAALIGKPFR